MTNTTFSVRYDYRGPGVRATERQQMYARSLEQATFLDQRGFDALVLSEHHASEDGYLPSPIPVAAAMAAVTARIPISISALIANLYEPLRLAEDLAVLDHLSAGRVAVTFGLGYRPEEYALHGRPWTTRGDDIEERIQVILQAWAGEPFDFQGRTVQILPRPFSRPHPMLFYGGGSAAAARRAARLDLHFQPQHNDGDLVRTYEDECRALGREPGYAVTIPPGPAYVFCTEDPDRFWADYGHHLLADARAYQDWQSDQASFVDDPSRTVAEMREAGQYAVVTPDELVARIATGEVQLINSHPACGGLPAEPSWESLRLLADVVMPAVRGS